MLMIASTSLLLPCSSTSAFSPTIAERGEVIGGGGGGSGLASAFSEEDTTLKYAELPLPSLCSGCGGDVESSDTRPIIITSYQCPPIPTRNFDWCAYRDGDEESPARYGWGATEQDAIDELLAMEN